MKKWKICRKEPVMKMMVEYHDAGRGYSRDMFDHLKFICTSSTAQGGGGSFKNRKPIGEVGCCESGMAERSH